MREDVLWQDGNQVRSDDVIFTWNAISDPVNGSWIPGSDYIDSVEQVNQYSFTVNYNTIYPGT
jgi:ABC-type transport system substrate-binding protein